MARARPDGLRELVLSWRCGPSEVKYRELAKSLGGRPGFEISERHGIRGLIGSDSQYARYHAHVFVTPPPKKQERWRFELELYSSRAKVPDKKAITVSKIASTLAPYLTLRDGTVRGMLVARFILRSSTWEPTVPVPFSAPSVVAGVPGVPKIVGVDFEFDDSGQPLRRAFVAAYDAVHELRVDFLVAFAAPLDDQLIEAMLREASKDLPLLARRRIQAEASGD